MHRKAIYKFHFISGFLVVLPIIMYRGISIGFILLAVIDIITILKSKKMNNDILFISLFVLSVLTTVILFLNNMTASWKYGGLVNFLLFAVIIFFKTQMYNIYRKVTINSLIVGIRWGLLLQLIWGYLQFFLSVLFRFDLNRFIFTDTLHIIDRASRISVVGIVNVSGLGWHPAQLVPIVILLYLMFDNTVIKFLTIGMAGLSSNSTCQLAILLCLIYDLSKMIKRNKKDYVDRRQLLIRIGGIVVIIAISLLNANIIDIASGSINKLFSRLGMVINNDVSDLSTSFHLRYYTYLPSILRKSSWINILFGYGYDCSGYPYTLFLNQYSKLRSWSVETDYVNFVLGRGIIWTFVFYYWIIRCLRLGKKINKKYTFFFFNLLVCGVLYNVQFVYVIFIECVMDYCIRNKMDFFADAKKGNKLSVTESEKKHNNR